MGCFPLLADLWWLHTRVKAFQDVCLNSKHHPWHLGCHIDHMGLELWYNVNQQQLNWGIGNLKDCSQHLEISIHHCRSQIGILIVFFETFISTKISQDMNILCICIVFWVPCLYGSTIKQLWIQHYDTWTVI